MNYLQIKDEKLMPTVVELNTLLADYHMYYQNLRNFHWNVLGPNFFELHRKFEELYTDARIKIDEIAERILTLRYHPVSRLSEYIEISKISEVKTLLSDREMVMELLNNHTILLSRMKTVIQKASEAEDEGTIDLIGAYIRELEKESWMLNAWCKTVNEKLKRANVEA